MEVRVNWISRMNAKQAFWMKCRNERSECRPSFDFQKMKMNFETEVRLLDNEDELSGYEVRLEEQNTWSPRFTRSFIIEEFHFVSSLQLVIQLTLSFVICDEDMVSCHEDHFEWVEARIQTSSSYEASHKRWPLRFSSLWLFSLWSYGSLSCCLMIMWCRRQVAIAKTMSIKPLRVTSSFMVLLSLHNESSILLLHKNNSSKTNRTTKRA